MMVGRWYKKGLVFGIIVLLISMSVLSSVSSKDISISDDKILEDNNENEPLDARREIFTGIYILAPEGYTYYVNKSGGGIFFRHVEIWSEVSFEISGYYLGFIFPRYFSESVHHVVAPRCFVVYEDAYFPGFGFETCAYAIGNIEWS